MKAIVSETGQVTIPEPLREELDIRPGEVLELAREGNRLVATKVSYEERLNSARGVLRHLNKTTDELLDELRGEPDGL